MFWEIKSSYRYRLEGMFLNYFGASDPYAFVEETSKIIRTGDFSST